jgi:hypothetical protein
MKGRRFDDFGSQAAFNPSNGGPVTIGDINVILSTLSNGDTGVAQLNSNPTDGAGILNFAIPVNLSGVGTVYTIANSAFGEAGHTAGEITFNATGGLSFTYQYTEGDNIRDHANTTRCALTHPSRCRGGQAEKVAQALTGGFRACRFFKFHDSAEGGILRLG